MQEHALSTSLLTLKFNFVRAESKIVVHERGIFASEQREQGAFETCLSFVRHPGGVRLVESGG